MPDRDLDLGATLVSVGAFASSSSASESAPALTILYHPEIERIGECVLPVELLAGLPVELSRTSLDFAAPGSTRSAPLGHGYLSRVPILLMALDGGGIRLSLGESRTVITHRGEPLRDTRDFLRAEVARGVVLEMAKRIVLLLHLTSPSPCDEGERFGLVGESASMARVRREIRAVADLDLPVLIRGETGTGKELVARAIHDTGARRSGPFVAVNMGAIPASLAASELFGAAQGAYTGAGKGQPGYFAVARGGTLLLDEIGDAPPDVQVLLLRALETGEVQGVGAQRPHKADVRIIAATDANLEVRVADGRFRAPLHHRLSSYEIVIAPLRERRDDIGRLLRHFFREELARLGASSLLGSTTPAGRPWLPASLVARLADHDWRGNVRQLRNVVRQIVIGSRGKDHISIGPPIERLLGEASSVVEDDAARSSPASAPDSLAGGSGQSSRRKPAEVSEEEIREALRACRWDRKAAANRLRISRASLYMLLDDDPRFRMGKELTEDEVRRSYSECRGAVDRMVERLEVSEASLRRRLKQMGLE
jgi:two-component system, NtrC family, nitrogen regulation response regulator GlnG